MAKKSSIIFPFLFILLLLLHQSMGKTTEPANSQHSWCIAKPSTSEIHLVDNIQFACSETNCNPIQPRGACFQPNTTLSHASVAMNLYYQAKGRNSWNCNFNGSGLIVSTDPSYGSCKYALGS